jgi:CelD/BcsL family acetyltransferase involved in cellulose biosynthesis
LNSTASWPDGEFTLDHTADITSIREEWTKLADQAGNIFGTWEWADAWYRHLGEGSELAVGIARRADGTAASILPLCVVRERPIRMLRFVGAGPSDQLGPICAPCDLADGAAALRRHVLQTLGRSGIFLGERLRGEDNVGDRLGAIALRRAATPSLPIADRTFEQFLASRSRNLRQQVTGRERRLMQRYDVNYRLTEDLSQVEPDMRTLIRLHRSRWGDSGSVTFDGRHGDLHLEFARTALLNGWLRLWTMELDGAPMAAWYGLRYGGVESYYQAGRDTSCDHLNIGFVLLCHTIRQAFDDGLREYRFGLGDEPYKFRFAERDHGLDTVAITAGVRGRLALAGIGAALKAPARLRAVGLRVAKAGRGRPDRAQTL